MQVELRLLASMRRRLPEKDSAGGVSVFDLSDGATCRELLEKVNIGGCSTLVVLVNGRYAAPERELLNGDVVSVFPPIAGG